MTKPVLTYFDIKGRGEVVRMAFVAGGIDFEDRRISPEQFAKEYKAKSPSGKLPMLEIGSDVYVETVALLKYVCAMSGNVPQSPKDQMVTDMILEQLNELTSYATQIYVAPNDAARSKAIEEAKTAVSDILPKVEKMVSQHSGEPGHVVKGKKFSPADLAVFAFVSGLSKKMMGVDVGDVASTYPSLWKIREAVLNDNQPLQAYLSSQA
eukprot:Protomagalhaensia_wolfi_Nauph_80__3708@NODE_3749_length_720_cov_6_405286_g2957_i0_p1_GENE_NODE_3749_length_720_cov_6_405286_g2957_i0NODE_3749_length_720_cov_6_405286_g2957_i0_p1_ORF_typecomplete_len209_score43_60GST_N/PF02798_20/1_5e12GST_C_3/PF14497_6/8_1e08GST_N_3/PF13417_6/2_9e07GST_C_5/PF16865_5/0_00032GST_C/PF00043_25/0_0038DUF3619/PF12279_8/0_056Focal_AT/PF03623_13/0_083GST_N_4/PF17172_4/0_28_NODE_3749_length_720_cov_6_405286_g2957_i048674